MESETMGANVTMIRSEGVRLVRGRIPRQVRTELMQGVKDGLLGRLGKDGHRPEAFFHPDQNRQAIERRDAEAVSAIARLARVLG